MNRFGKKEKTVKDPGRHLGVREVVDQRWEVIRVIGEGGFGAVYEVRDVTSVVSGSGSDASGPSAQTFAMKVEALSAPVDDQVLRMDVNILRRIQDLQSKHFVKLYGIGSTDRLHYMVTSLVGPNLHDLKKKNKGKKFRFRTVAHIAIGSLQALRDMHNIGYLHRDVKPANLAIGKPPQLRELYLLDFGLCRQFKHEDGRLRRPRTKAGFRGTMRYAPLACHKSMETARADDLWNWLYVMIEFAAGRLPWDSEVSKTRQVPLKEAIKRIGALKEAANTAPTELMDGCPTEFMLLHEHIASLDFQAEPNYDLMLSALKAIEERRQKQDKDGEALDWEDTKGKKKEKGSKS